MLYFNLLPIIPLDGSKIFIFFLYRICSYQLSCFISIIFSFISIFLFLIFIYPNIDYNYLLIILILLIDISKYIKNLKYYFNKFLLERYLYDFAFLKQKKIKKVSQMYKDYRHLIYDGKKYVTERSFLKKMFDF